MINSNFILQRSKTQLSFKIKLVVFYSSEEDKDLLFMIRNECTTYTCKYSLIPIHIELEKNINEINIKKNIKNHVSGYKKNLDKVCIITSNMGQVDQYVIFDSVNSFKLWFRKLEKE